jgi:hypothetical protein
MRTNVVGSGTTLGPCLLPTLSAIVANCVGGVPPFTFWSLDNCRSYIQSNGPVPVKVVLVGMILAIATEPSASASTQSREHRRQDRAVPLPWYVSTVQTALAAIPCDSDTTSDFHSSSSVALTSSCQLLHACTQEVCNRYRKAPADSHRWIYGRRIVRVTLSRPSELTTLDGQATMEGQFDQLPSSRRVAIQLKRKRGSSDQLWSRS